MNAKLNGWYWVIAIVVILLIGAVYTNFAKAQQVFNVQHDGVPAFCATGVVAGTWNFTGTCAPPPVDPGTAPAGRLLRGQNCMTYTSTGPSCYVADYTSWQDTFGRYLDNTTRKPTQPAIAFPGVNYYAIAFNFTKTGYAAFEFTAPANLPPRARGLFGRAETMSGPAIDSSISEAPGDFDPATVSCKKKSYTAGALKWKNASIPDNQVYACPLTPGKRYFYNVRVSATGTCNGYCYIGFQNNYTQQ